jgi:glycosyltransferase 2 family protein
LTESLPTSSENIAPGKSGRVGLLLKAAVTIGVLGWLFWRADWGGLADRIAGASPVWLAAGFLIKGLTVPLAAERWRVVAGAVGATFDRWTGLKLMLAGLFLGQALPGAVGGDLVRGWLTYRHGLSASATITALVADRAAALLGVLIVMGLGGFHLVKLAPGVGLAVAVVGGGVMCAATAAFYADLMPLSGWLARREAVAALRAAVRRLRYGSTGWTLSAALGVSAAVHLCTVIATAAYAQALDMPVTTLDCLAVVPFSIIAAALPLSLAGWGVREGSMIAAFALTGLPADDALLLSLLIGFSVLAHSLPGAPVWLAWSADRRAASGFTTKASP